MKYDKKFIIINNMNSITYKEIFPLLKDNRMWIGYTRPKQFLQPDGSLKSFGNILWYTNIDIKKRHESLILSRRYSDDPNKYPHYDNYNAINVDKVHDIPEDYEGVMGVPISFLDKYCPEQFEIVWQGSGNTRVCAPDCVLAQLGYRPHPDDRGGCGVVKGRRVYSRVFIRRKREAYHQM